MNGTFYRLEATSDFPPTLKDGLPQILWIPAVSPRGDGTPVVVQGYPIGASAAQPVPLVRLRDDGSLQPQFSVEDTIRGILREEYHSGLTPVIEMRLPFNYSLVPNWVKGIAARLLAFRGAAEPAVDFPGYGRFEVEWLRKLGSLSPGFSWPEGKRAAAIITHDVDTAWIFRNSDWLEKFCDVQEKHGFHGAWYCVPRNSESKVAERAMRRLIDRGCEIGVHGYNHDAKWPLLDGHAFDRRLETARRFAAQWNAQGFRSEWLFRTPRFLEALAGVFRYDSSVPATERSGIPESANGCASCLPYRTNGDLIELPLTLPMDIWHGGLPLNTFWERQLELSRAITRKGGLTVVSLHPQPHQAANEKTLQVLDAALQAIAADKSVWIAKPCEVAEWAAKQDLS
jgi:peptidoglycan/xylan/chitin deacetylase (PgdA/CDA1 family)